MNTKVQADTDGIETSGSVENLATKGKSMSDIAAIMAANTRARMEAKGESLPTPKPSPNEVTDEDDNEAETGDELLDDSSGDAEEQTESDVTPDEEQHDDDDSEAADEDTAAATPEEFEIDDEDLVALDDNTTVSLGELKRIYQSDETVKVAVQEQQEATQEAVRERAKALDDGQKASVAMSAVFQHIEQLATQQIVSPPDESIKTSDPTRYIAHLEAYQQDQARIQQSRQALNDAMTTHAEKQKELLNNKRAHEMRILAEKLPALRDERTRSAASQDILDAAEHYGFSKEEVNLAADHRMFRMAYEAQQFRKLMAKSGKTIEDLKEIETTTGKKSTRTLRSRGTSAKTRLNAKAKQRKVLVNKAKKTGHVNDVAALIASKRST